MSLYYTNAPEDYDYGYVTTVKFKSEASKWRLIRVTDEEQFQGYQTPRYNSGMYVAVSAIRSDLLPVWGLEPLSLHEALGALGLTTHDSDNGKKDILEADTSFVVFQGRAGEVWDWLRESGRLA